MAFENVIRRSSRWDILITTLEHFTDDGIGTMQSENALFMGSGTIL
jgi:hypothetical protein